MSSWYEADYFPSFQCKCGACRHTCCSGWQIDVSEKEYFYLIGLDCSETLHRKLECAFAVPETVSEETFRVMAPDWRGNCHLLDTDGKCMLQKECGEAALPKICRYYPRSLRQEGQHRRACCSASCEAVAEALLKEDKLHIIKGELAEGPLLAEEEDEPAYMLSLRCMRLLQDRTLPLKERIGRIAVAVGCDSVPKGAELEAAAEKLTELAPNLPACFAREAPVSSDTERQKENLLANHLIYTDFPYTDKRLKPEESAYGLMLVYYLLTKTDGHTGDALADAYAEVFRLAEHTAFYYNAAVLLGKEPLH